MKIENHGLKPCAPTKSIDRTFSVAPMLDWMDFADFSGLQAGVGAAWGLGDLFGSKWGTVNLLGPLRCGLVRF